MSNLSEEEILREIRAEIETEKSENCMFAKWLDIKHLEGLLDLYTKEKEKNKELVEEFPKILEEATKNSISKDKIRNEIKELTEEYEKCSRENTFKKAKLLYQINILKEILEEN